MILAGLLASSLFLAADAATPAPPAAAPKDQILGVWKGSSTCTKIETNDLCRDETVVYNIFDVPGQPATVTLKAARIVDGIVQPMYSLYFTYRPESGAWTSEFKRPSFSGVWSYVIQGDEMKGTATIVPKGTIVRSVTAKRTTQAELDAH